MILTNKILPVALIAALLGGSVGALIMHRSQPAATDRTTQATASYMPAANQQALANDGAQMVPAQFTTSGEQTAYKTGFADGYDAALRNDSRTTSANRRTASTQSRVVYRNAVSRTSQRRVYYDYNRSSGRSFWSKHRDKLTVAIGTGAGAVIGGLIGGNKGAAIGALSGAGGSALYTYKIRKRNRNY